MWHSVRDQIILFGGLTTGPYYNNDMWAFDTSKSTWTAITPAGTLPGGRYLHPCTVNSVTGDLYVYGGWFVIPIDLWQYSWASNQWSLLDTGRTDIIITGHSVQYSAQYNSIFSFFGCLANETNGKCVGISVLFLRD